MESAKYELVASNPTSASSLQVWTAMQIWYDKPHITNRRIIGAQLLFQAKLKKSVTLHELWKLFDFKIARSMTDEEIVQVLTSTNIVLDNDSDDEFGRQIVLKKLLPRNSELRLPSIQIEILDKMCCKVTCINLQSRPEQPMLTLGLTFTFQFVEGEIQLVNHGSVSCGEDNVLWLKSHVLPKIQKWAENAAEEKLSSLSLVPLNEYNTLYQELKKKYGQKMVKIWPEVTDPSKFVYEDVAIAAYLLLLWEEQRKSMGQPDFKQSFVDLGCGNGLLVHILSSEGHKGFGIDVRKRGIWDMYPSTTVLKVQAITPSDDFLFPEVDWIIGNHSDELTPWIPVIAARSSYTCSFFVLPCCSYDLSGSKYRRQCTNQSIYSEYLDYVQNLCNVCGFECQRDKLRIPSTKRTCLIGSKRNHSNDDIQVVEKRMKEFINERCRIVNESPSASGCEAESWVQGFKPREGKEIVRNCTKVDKSIIDRIIEIVVSLILQDHKKSDGGMAEWNAGSPISIGEVATAIPQELLNELKKECGGLQTLLKNNHHIFNVLNGKVQFRTPISMSQKWESLKRKKNFKNSEDKLKLKRRPCWFYRNHPDGCPLKNEDCSFEH